jgi:hypothetical protein
METQNNPFGQQPKSTDDGKLAAIVSYFGIIFWVISYFAIHKDKKTDFGSYQLRQTLLSEHLFGNLGFHNWNYCFHLPGLFRLHRTICGLDYRFYRCP